MSVSGYGPYEPATDRASDPVPGFCPADVLEKDAYRYTGRTKGGFEQHWRSRQCKCRPLKGKEFCHAHRYLEESTS